MGLRCHLAVWLVLLLFGCAEWSGDAPVGTARLALTGEVLRADRLVLTVDGPEGTMEVWSSTAPHAAATAVFVPLGPGDYDGLMLDGRLAELPFLTGRSAPFTVTAGSTTDVRLVVDPVGLLQVVPIGLPLEVPVVARPLDPLPGDPLAVALAPTEDGAYTASLFAGRYRVELDVPVDLDLVTDDVLEIEVVAGARAVLRPAFGSAGVVQAAAVVDRLLVDVVGGGVLIAGAARDLVVTAVDADGRQVAGYRGEVAFSVADALPAPPELPEPHRFDDADAGRRVFAGGLVAPVVAAVAPFTLVVRDEANGLETTVPLCIELPPLVTGCPP